MPKSKDDSRRRYIDEPLARATILTRLADRFTFIEEVEAVDAGGPGLLIALRDAVWKVAEPSARFVDRVTR